MDFHPLMRKCARVKINTRSHTGKIARLPREIRNQLARGIGDGIPGARLVTWLNSLPEVQAILQREFGGQPIKPQNLSKWKIRGYPDWLQEQAFMAATIDIITQNHAKLTPALSPGSSPDAPSR